MSRSDYAVSFVISQINAVFVLLLLFTLRMEIPYGSAVALGGAKWWIFVFSPVVTFLFLRFFCRWAALSQFGRFWLISVSNFMIDFGVLNLLMYQFGVAEGLYYSVFKAASFILANMNGYAWNRFWTFGSWGAEGWTSQFMKFFGVVGVGLVINVTVASAVVAKFSGSGPLSPTAWANIGALAPMVVTLFWNFFGLKHLVFDRRA